MSLMMLQLPIFSYLFTSLLFLFMLVRHLKRSQKAKGAAATSKPPPGPWKLPVLGNLHQLAMAGSVPPHKFFRELSKKHGPVMHMKLGEISAVVISSPEAAEEVLKTHDISVAQRPDIVVNDMLPFGYGILFSPYGEFWRQIRKICVLKLLNAKRAQSFRPIREEESWNLMEFISKSQGVPFNFSDKIFSMANDITSRAAFGKKCKDRAEFIAVIKEVSTLGTGFELPDIFPSVKVLRYFSRMRPAIKVVGEKLGRILENIISDHKADREAKVNSRKDDQSSNEDFVDVLLGLQKCSDLEFQLTTNNIKAVVLDIFSAGSETSATTIEWSMSELLKNPKVMENAQAEVRQVFAGKNKIQESDIEGLHYLKALVKETLRLHPPATLIPREAREKCEVSGYEIPAKTKIIVNTWALGRDEKKWTNVESYQPERFLDTSINYKGTHFHYIPFGAGRRMCPGITFAIPAVELPLAQLLYHFDWKLAHGIKPEELDMDENFGIASKRVNDLHLTATLRIPFAE